jgi:hypothetical protein
VTCSPAWCCLRYGCPRCDRQRRHEADRLAYWRAYAEVVAARDERETDPSLNHAYPLDTTKVRC